MYKKRGKGVPKRAVRPAPTAIDGHKPGPRHALTGAGGTDRMPDLAEHAQHTAWGHLQTLRPAYAHLLDLGERGRGREHAATMMSRIEDVLARGGWTVSERTTLYAARDKWRRRADGKDPRYLLTGGDVRGRLPAHVQRGVEVMRTVEDALEEVLAFAAGVRQDDGSTR